METVSLIRQLDWAKQVVEFEFGLPKLPRLPNADRDWGYPQPPQVTEFIKSLEVVNDKRTK